MQEQVRLRSSLSPDALREALAAVVEPTDWPPPLIFKLSGGGIVSRVMESPATERAFFGLVSAEKIRIARASRGRQVTPFQPILLIELSAEQTGSQLNITLRPHREARSLSGVFALAGFTLIGAALPAMLSLTPIAFLAAGVGLSFMWFPTWRAKTCFRTDLKDAMEALTEALPVEPVA